MSTPVIALTQHEAEAIARATAALSWTRADTVPWAFARSGEIKAHADELRGSLDDYADLATGRSRPDTLFPDLEAGAMETALDRVTEDIRAWTGAVVTLANEAEDAARMQEEGVAA